VGTGRDFRLSFFKNAMEISRARRDFFSSSFPQQLRTL